MNERVTEAAILRIARLCEEAPQFGRVKLQKLLLKADLRHKQQTGRALTGLKYVKDKNGPMSREVLPLCRKLIREGRAQERSLPGVRYPEMRLVAIEPEPEGVLTEEQERILDAVVRENFDRCASELSDESHELLAWKVARMGQDIPLGAMLVTTGPLTPEEKAFGMQFSASLDPHEP